MKNMHFPPEKYIADRLISEGCSLLGARPKAGKSWLALDLAWAVSNGREFLGQKCEQGVVLYLALEDGPRRLKSRYSRLATSEEDWNGALHFANEWPRGKDAIDALKEWMKEHPSTRLIIVDTYQRIKEAPKGKNGANYADDYDAGAMFQSFAREFGVSVLLIHHTKKADADDPFDTLSGTLGNNAAADSLMVIKSDRQGRTVLHARGRDMAGYSLPVDFDKATCRWVKAESRQATEHSETESKILEALANADGDLSIEEIAEVTGLLKVTVKVTLGRQLGQPGMWTKVARGRYKIAPHQDFEPLA